jgi:glycosyltransferase involved in cell wall biosynthesis
VDGIAQAMYFLAANEDKRTMFGRNAREHIVNNFNHLVQMDKLQNIYDEFLLDTKRI